MQWGPSGPGNNVDNLHFFFILFSFSNLFCFKFKKKFSHKFYFRIFFWAIFVNRSRFYKYISLHQRTYFTSRRHIFQCTKEFISLHQNIYSLHKGIYFTSSRNILQLTKKYILLHQKIYITSPMNIFHVTKEYI